MIKTAVLGAGSWGTAIAVLLAKKGTDVTLWEFFKENAEQISADRENKKYLPGTILPDNIICTNDLETAVSDADYVVCAVPSKAVDATSRSLAPFYKENQIIINLAKGLDANTFERMSEVIRKNIPNAKIAVLTGPSHAEEVALGMATTVVAAGDTVEIAEEVQDLFMCDTFRVYVNPDMAGAEYGGALKNVIALCAGIADGLGLGDNAKAALMTRGMTEIARLGVAMGARLDTFFGLTGMGDLIVTCTSMHSRNRRAGILIGKGMKAEYAVKEVKMVVEGVPAAAAAHSLAKKAGVEMPICEMAYNILFCDVLPGDAVKSLMTRQKRHEPEDTIRRMD